MFAFTNDRSYMAQATLMDWLYLLFFKTIIITTLTLFSLLFSLLLVRTLAAAFDRSTDKTTVVNTGSCGGGFIVNNPEFRKVIRKLFEQLALTIFLTIFAYNLTACFLFLLWSLPIEHFVFLYLFLLISIKLLYYFGFLYLVTVSQLASVVSVLEEEGSCYGVKAMIKGMDLVKGTKWLALDVSCMFNWFLAFEAGGYMLFVDLDEVADLAPMWHVAIGILCCVLFMLAYLAFEADHALLYEMFKSDHRDEIIGKVSLSTYLGAYITSDSQPAAITQGEDIIPQNQPVLSEV